MSTGESGGISTTAPPLQPSEPPATLVLLTSSQIELPERVLLFATQTWVDDDLGVEEWSWGGQDAGDHEGVQEATRSHGMCCGAST